MGEKKHAGARGRGVLFGASGYYFRKCCMIPVARISVRVTP
jgi:hypothetical protein